MHEMGIAQQIVKIASAAIPEDQQNRPVERINTRIGKLTAVAPESLCFCFDIIVKETPLSGARLVIEAVPARGRCLACGFEWQITEPVFMCRKCRNGSIDIVSGRELEVVSIEISDTSKDPDNAER
jgi:hydrogenase nickel incorporation protein HypA/HybF